MFFPYEWMPVMRAGGRPSDDNPGARSGVRALLSKSSTALLLAVCMSLAGCARSPDLNVFGSFFPSWMVCALVGLVFAAVMHRVFGALGIDKALPAPLLVYLSLAVAFTFATWLIWLG
jgi:lipopolysaccharide export LptBFGC system permease protein LptF